MANLNERASLLRHGNGRALLISGTFPADPKRFAYGVYQRLRMFSEAVAAEADGIDMLFFARIDVPLAAHKLQEVQDSIRTHWGIDAKVTVMPCRTENRTRKFFHYYVLPAFNVERQESFSYLVGPDQVAAVRRALETRPAWVFAHRLQSLWICLMTKVSLPPVLLDLDDVEHKYRFRRVFSATPRPGEILTLLQLPALMLAERRAIKAAQLTYVCSTVDHHYLKKIYRVNSIETIPNASLSVPFVRPSGDGNTIMFVGKFTYPPNSDAAERLIRYVFPLVRQSIPAAKVLVVGDNPDAIPSYTQKPAGVEFTGFVDNLTEVYSRARVICCPIAYGSGTRIKIIEAAAYGKAIVSTAVGAEGLDFENEREIIIRDGVDAIAAACIDLLRDEARCRALGLAAQRQFLKKYERSSIVNRIRQTITQATSP